MEVLEQGVALEDIKIDSHRPQRYTRYGGSSRSGEGTAPEDDEGRVDEVRGALGPTCAGVCLIGGEKAYNEMVRAVDLDP